VIASARVREPFWGEDAGVWRHGYTYAGHATATAAAHPNLDIMEHEDMLGRSLELERELFDGLAPLAEHELVAEVRAGLGAVAAVQPVDPAHGDLLTRAARDAGVLTRTLVGGGMQVSPPLVFTRDDVAELAVGFRAALDAVAVRV
jgi:adenosylmethionine-8-amino-7-oxononanoate aminotransferase